MEDWKELQRQAYQNKVDHGFNVTDVPMEFCLLYGEVGEAYQAWSRQKPDLGEELADVAIYLLGLAEILDVDLGQEVRRKMDINRRRRYGVVDGVWQRLEDGSPGENEYAKGRRPTVLHAVERLEREAAARGHRPCFCGWLRP